jgi:hypothetical protein
MNELQQLIFMGGVMMGMCISMLCVYFISVVEYRKKHRCSWLEAIIALDS